MDIIHSSSGFISNKRWSRCHGDVSWACNLLKVTVSPENMSVVLMQTPNPPEEKEKALSCSLMGLKLELGDLRNYILGQSELVSAEHSLCSYSGP